MIERYLLRYFLAVADHANFSRAAQQCNVSQPTLSVGIAKLEEALQVPLFVRTNRQVRLTPAGNRLLVHARRIETEFNLAAMSVAAPASSPDVRLGVLNSIAGEELARIVALARARDPGARFELVPGTARELNGKLGQGRIDAALTIMTGAGSRFEERPLRDEGFALVVPARHSLAEETMVAAEDVATETMIVRRHCESLAVISRFFTERGIRPRFALRATNDERVLQMIGAGLGITVMPDSYRASGVRSLRLAGFDLRRTLGIARAAAPGRCDVSLTSVVLAAADVLRADPASVATAGPAQDPRGIAPCA